MHTPRPRKNDLLLRACLPLYRTGPARPHHGPLGHSPPGHSPAPAALLSARPQSAQGAQGARS